ncbi:MAG: carbohydrate kinase [Candidatus Sumerlaeota bacterium]|nr:carbohydrate kinase [Candidatus Sumerlaeota bacterium]
MAKTVLAFGETLWDLLPDGPALGGAPFNFIYRVNSLGDRGLIVSRLGRDELGRQAFERARELGLDLRFMQWDEERPTGTVRVQVDAEGNPDFFIVPDTAYDRIESGEALLQAAAQADCLCFGTLIQRAAPSRETLRHVIEATPRRLKFLDINLRKNCHTKETVHWSLAKADILKLNEDEAAYLAQWLGLSGRSLSVFAQEMPQRWGFSHCLITLGSRGALAAEAGKRPVYVPGYKVEVVDTCGSGDAFSAGFLHRLLKGDALEECCRFGNLLGAMAATQAGGTAPISAEDIQSFAESAHARIWDERCREYACE